MVYDTDWSFIDCSMDANCLIQTALHFQVLKDVLNHLALSQKQEKEASFLVMERGCHQNRI